MRIKRDANCEGQVVNFYEAGQPRFAQLFV
jgi:hypothetical protein